MKNLLLGLITVTSISLSSVEASECIVAVRTKVENFHRSKSTRSLDKSMNKAIRKLGCSVSEDYSAKIGIEASLIEGATLRSKKNTFGESHPYSESYKYFSIQLYKNGSLIDGTSQDLTEKQNLKDVNVEGIVALILGRNI